jgi:phospholipid/cholesterol/gamma-HCH transport system substrate-binding protein
MTGFPAQRIKRSGIFLNDNNMATKKWDKLKLGLFVLAGLAALIFALFMVGQNISLFQSSYSLSARFRNVGGLKQGNNVRYGGIDIGTVKKVKILDDTTIQVDMLIKKDMDRIIRQNASAGIGTDGLIGNRVVNIFPGTSDSPYATNGDLLSSKLKVSPEEMMETLSKSNRNIAEITEKLKFTVNRINSSEGLWKVLNDTSLAIGLKRSLSHIEKAAGNAEWMTGDLTTIVGDVKAGKGNIGKLLRDSSIVIDMGETIGILRKVAGEADQLALHLDQFTTGMDQEIQRGNGTLNKLLKDTVMAGNLSRSLSNVEKGTAEFNENMKALQHNFLFRGYFRKKEKAHMSQTQSQ